MTTREERLADDVRLLLDLLAALPPFRGDWVEGGKWDNAVWPAKFWIDYADSYVKGTPPKEWAGYMGRKLESHISGVLTDQRAGLAADLAMYCLMFFSQSGNARACELLGSRFTGNFRVPEGDATIGRRWIEQVLPVCWRISLGVRKDPPGLVPDHQVDPPTKLEL